MVGLGLVIRGNHRLARYAAPAAFLLAVTIAVLIVRAGLSNGVETTPSPTTTTTVATTTAVTESEPPATTSAGTTTEATGAEFYEIEPGDTLADVANRFDTTVEQLLVLNPDADPVALTIGERIRVK